MKRSVEPLIETIRSGIDRTAMAWTSPSLWGRAVGLARSLLALGLALTLLATPTRSLFFLTDGAHMRACRGLADDIGLFCVLPDAGLGVARIVAAALLLVVASGWRPRWTAIPHWWLTYSFFAGSIAVDGGDHTAGVLTFLLLPLGLTDDRRWHWSLAPADPGSWRALIAFASLTMIRLQVAVIYLQAAVAKFGVTEWADGTALYYWFQHPFFGAPDWASTLTDPILRSGAGVTALTWGTLVLELALVVAIIGRPAWRRPMLTLGVAFHLGIALVMGLASFAFSMSAALLLALWAPDEVRWVRRWWARARRRHRLARRRRGPVDRPGSAPAEDVARPTPQPSPASTLTRIEGHL